MSSSRNLLSSPCQVQSTHREGVLPNRVHNRANQFDYKQRLTKCEKMRKTQDYIVIHNHMQTSCIMDA